MAFINEPGAQLAVGEPVPLLEALAVALWRRESLLEVVPLADEVSGAVAVDEPVPLAEEESGAALPREEGDAVALHEPAPLAVPLADEVSDAAAVTSSAAVGEPVPLAEEENDAL